MIANFIPTVNRFFPFLFLLFVVGIFTFPSHAFALTVDARTGTHIRGTINGAGYFHVDPVDVSGSDVNGAWTDPVVHDILITGCGSDGNCNLGYSAFSPNAVQPDPNHVNGSSGAQWLDIASTTDVSTINGGGIYNNIHSSWPGYCTGTSPVVCTGIVMTDGGWTGFGGFFAPAGSPYVLFTVDSTGLVTMDNTGAVSLTTQTRIDTTSPADGDTIATSSLPWNYETTGYVNSDEYKSGTRLRIKIDRNTDNQAVGALTAFNSAFGNYTYLNIPSAGLFDVSTTTITNTFGVNRVGTYTMYQDIQTPGIGIHWWLINFDLTYNTLVTKRVVFTVGAATGIDILSNSVESYLQTAASSTTDVLATCQFNWFSSAVDFSLGSNLMNCMGGLVQWALVPPASFSMTDTLNSLRTGILARWPWGYATRFVSILSDTTATSTLPSFTATVPTSASTTLDFTYDPGDMIAGAGGILAGIHANGTSLNFRDIFEPWLEMFLAISLLILMVTDLMAMGHHESTKSGKYKH